MPKTARAVRNAITTALLTTVFFGLAINSASAVDGTSHTTIFASALPDCGSCGTGF